MATTSSPRTAYDGGGVGGKIVKNRRVSKTPYSRPSPPPPTPPPSDDIENPNWLSGFIYPAKFIASGAGKILSFFGNDYSSSSSGAGDSSENDDDEEEIENDISFQEDDQLDKVMSPSSKSDNKCAIEQLVTQETFSRKEANELIKLVRSRIVGSNGALGETTPNIRTSAIMEARKWLQEKRSGSKKKFENDLDASPSQVSRNEKGSPVDMARSYMQNRPAWASPSLKQAEVGTSSPLGMLHFKEESPMSTLRSSELKKGSFTSGSWNLLEEIRRVRTKATEEFLAAAPLTKTVLFTSESNPPQDSLLNKGDVVEAGPAEPTHDRPEIVLPEAEASTRYTVGQDGEAVQCVENQESQEAAVLGLTHNENDEVKQLKSSTVKNGYGLAQGQDTTNEEKLLKGENENPVDSSQVERDIHMEENLNLQEEFVINGSQNSSSMQQEELSQSFSQPVAEDGPAPKAKGTPKDRKLRGGYTRRARARGK